MCGKEDLISRQSILIGRVNDRCISIIGQIKYQGVYKLLRISLNKKVSSIQARRFSKYRGVFCKMARFFTILLLYIASSASGNLGVDIGEFSSGSSVNNDKNTLSAWFICCGNKRWGEIKCKIFKYSLNKFLLMRDNF